MSQKAREVIGAIEAGKMSVEGGLRELERWRGQREAERRRLERRERPRPAHWLGVRIADAGSRRRFGIWLPMFLVYWSLSFAGWVAPRAMTWGTRRARYRFRWGTDGPFELRPADIRPLLKAVRQGLVACGMLVDVDDGQGSRVQVWLR